MKNPLWKRLAEGAGCRSWKVSGYFPVYDLEYWFCVRLSGSR